MFYSSMRQFQLSAFFVGPTGDLSFVGRHSEDNLGPNNNQSFSHSGSYRHLGLDLGIMAMF